MRHNPLRSKAVLSDLAGADAPLGRRSFLTLGAVLTGGLALGGKTAIADPAQEAVPILTIALDAGFQSLGPFNRAFKAETGLTPSEFRRHKLAQTAQIAAE